MERLVYLNQLTEDDTEGEDVISESRLRFLDLIFFHDGGFRVTVHHHRAVIRVIAHGFEFGGFRHVA